MKLKVLKSKKTNFPSYYTPVMIVVKGEEEKGEQQKGLKVLFSKTADKQLPVDFKGGIIDVDGSDINFPYIYEIKTNDNGEDDYPFVYIKKFNSVTPLKPRKNTCRFIGVEEESEEVEISESNAESDDTEEASDLKEIDLPDDDLLF